MLDVVVIGSGAAGVAAASRLAAAGLTAVCLEAAERGGGRVNTVPFAGGVVDLGAVQAEGSIGNILVDLAKPYGLMQDTIEQERFYVQSDGSELSKDTVEGFARTVDRLVAEADKQNTKSVAQFVEETIKTNASCQDPALRGSLVEWYERHGELGGQVDPKLGKSLRGMGIRKTCAGHFQSFKTGGMGTILDILMNKIPDPSKALPIDIQLHKEVDNIKWKGSSLVTVTCRDGSVYEAKSVISTISIGVLKERHTFLFDPPLPEEKLNTISNFHMLVLDKIFMEFSAPWWPAPSNFSVLWREQDKAAFSEADKWITFVYGIETVANQPNVIMGWINDEGARLMERTSEEDVKRGMDRLLLLLFKNKFGVTPIKTLLRTKWATNRWERGAYSYRSVYAEENGASAESLAEPLTDEDGFPVVCFAGEATVGQHQASVHGAIESGFREADRLISVLKEK